MKLKAKRGVWMPTAAVLCLECHGPNFPRYSHDPFSEEWEELIRPTEIEEGKAVTFCDRCREDIQVYESVAFEHNMVGLLQRNGVKAEMEQTGGMNSAGSVFCTDNNFYLFTFNMDGDNEWGITKLTEDYELIDGDYLGETFSSEDDLFEFIISREDIIRR